MTPFDPILHDHEKRIKMLEAVRRNMEDQLIVLDAIQRKQAARIEKWEEFLSDRIDFELEQKKREDQWKAQDEEWRAYHELKMREFDDKLNGLVSWLDDFVKRNPKNGK